METNENTPKSETTVATEAEKSTEKPNTDESPMISRKSILIRFLFTLLVLVAFWVFEAILLSLVLFQYIYLLITMNHSDGLRAFCNKIAAYAYRAFRYMSLNENARPFPFGAFPQETDPPEPEVFFN